MSEPEIKITKYSYWQPLPLDADGTPLAGGERMVEIEPGLWAHPFMAEAMEFLAVDHQPDPDGDERQGAADGGVQHDKPV